MALYKRNNTWWTDFSVNGPRYRESLETSDWREAQRLEKGKISQAQVGDLIPSNQYFARLAFSEAADRYLESRKLELSTRSLKKEQQLLVKPCHFFGVVKLSRISSEHVQGYREYRSRSGAGPAYINMEIGVIARILKRAKLWHLIAADIRPLKERRKVGRALSHEEKLRLLRIAESRSEWQVARCAAVVALNTTMRGCELKGLRWRNINLFDKTLTIERSKTEAGERVIPINANALAAILELYERARANGAAALDHYAFPACENGRIDPEKPQETWRTAWRRITQAIECPACGTVQTPKANCQNNECKAYIHNLVSPIASLRFHDLRHHAITELAESDASEQTILAIAGHVSSRMLRHYSHVRLEAKRTALDVLSRDKQSIGYGTNNVTRAQGHKTKPYRGRKLLK